MTNRTTETAHGTRALTVKPKSTWLLVTAKLDHWSEQHRHSQLDNTHINSNSGRKGSPRGRCFHCRGGSRAVGRSRGCPSASRAAAAQHMATQSAAAGQRGQKQTPTAKVCPVLLRTKPIMSQISCGRRSHTSGVEPGHVEE